jgi:hypothetical protein
MKCIARDLTLAVVVLALMGGVTFAGPKDGKKKPDEDGQKTIVIQLDVSKLPGDLLAQLLKAAGGQADKGIKKPGDKKPQPGDKKPQPGDKPDTTKVKQFGLAEAIAAAEKHTQGTAIKAEYEADGFVVAVKTSKGTSTVKMDWSGNIAGDKGKKKGDDDDKKPGKKKKKKDDDD